MKLPKKKWLSPEEATSLIAQKYACSTEEALDALIFAARDKEVDARAATSGATGNAALLNKDVFNRSGPERDARGDWQTPWEVRRDSILHWLQVQLELKLSANRKGIGGRPTKWDWEEFWLEICRYVHVEGLPETQADLVETMQQWFVDDQGNHPADSEIKKRISKVFKALKPADN
jgi:hypothetical protein